MTAPTDPFALAGWRRKVAEQYAACGPVSPIREGPPSAFARRVTGFLGTIRTALLRLDRAAIGAVSPGTHTRRHGV